MVLDTFYVYAVRKNVVLFIDDDSGKIRHLILRSTRAVTA